MSNPKNRDNKGLFGGGLFDLNGDGRTDAAEMTMMFMMFEEIQKETEREKQAKTSKTYDLDEFLNKNTTDLDDLDIEGI